MRSLARSPSSSAAETVKLPSMLGARIRHARRVARLTMTQLAVRAGCSESLISKIENAQATPSLAMLHRIAVALESNIASLTTEQVPAASPVLRKGERPVLRTGGIALERLVMAERGGLLQANIHIVEPGAASDGQIVHVGEEVGYVLAGKIELTLGEARHVLQAGDAFTFASQQPHGYRNLGRTVAKILWVNTPATF
jgi:transcriptional regulator with XRE-family HTH domain